MKQKTRDGILTDMPNGQDRLLAVLYGSVWGRMLLKPLTAPFVSRMAGKMLCTKASRCLIAPFVRKNQIDMTQFLPAKYESYNDFFSRQIRPDARTVDMEPLHFVSPCDSKLTVLPITKEGSFTIKQTRYTAQSLLKNADLAKQYEGGYAMIFRLTVDDYHRYSFPDNGTQEENVRIDGILHTVNPIAGDHYPIYKENSREYCVFHSRNFGVLVLMEVGALMVGRIVNHNQNREVHRGEEKGYFQFGGSTVVVLVQEGILRPDADILENSAYGIETVVKLGEKIGEKAD